MSKPLPVGDYTGTLSPALEVANPRPTLQQLQKTGPSDGWSPKDKIIGEWVGPALEGEEMGNRGQEAEIEGKGGKCREVKKVLRQN